MATKALVNGKVQAGVAVDDRGLQYGDGVFETIAVAETGPITRRIRRALIGENAIIPPC